jgi:hypothetical protein
MQGAPARVHWAVALAALVGGVLGSFVGASTAIYSYGSQPIAGGDAAIYVGSLAGAVVGASVAAAIALGVGRSGRAALGAVAGSVGGVVAGALVGYYAEGIAQWWISTYGGNALEGALVGGAIAGGYVGVAFGAVLSGLRKSGTPIRRVVQFAGLAGALAGMFAGMGGGSIGATLAQAASVCPNGYTSTPAVVSGCSAGILQGALLIGLWVGAILGAVGGLATAEILTLQATGGKSFRHDL